MRSVIIYLTGRPGVGKYTIAKELSKFDFITCDNQLINNPIFELVNYNGKCEVSELAWEHIANIRKEIFKFLIQTANKNYVLTNNLYEDEGDKELYNEVHEMAKARNSIFVPIRLSVEISEHIRRLTNIDRKQRFKTIDPIFAQNQEPLLPISHPNFL